MSPTDNPTESPTGHPTSSPTLLPTGSPTLFPTTPPTDAPTQSPTKAPKPTEAPNTSVPTAAPTPTLNTAPPVLTNAPTSGCAVVCNANRPFEVSITTDGYPEDTSWTLMDTCGAIWASGGSYGAFTLYGPDYGDHSVMLCEGEEYFFTILDAWGDSLCCNAGEGSYEVRLDGEILTQGGQDFGEGGTKDEYIFTVPDAKQVSCSAGCGSNTVNFELEILTDRYPGDTSWAIDNACGQEIAAGAGYGGIHTEYGFGHASHTVELCEGRTYNFTLYDSYGDSICCAYGNGYYKGYVGGALLFQGGENIGFKKTHTFKALLAPGGTGRALEVDYPATVRERGMQKASQIITGPPPQCPDPATKLSSEWHTIISESFEGPDFALGQYDCSAQQYEPGTTFFAQINSIGTNHSSTTTKNPFVHHARLHHTNTLRLNDNQGSNSAVFTEPIDISCFRTVELSFDYMTDRLKKIGAKDRNGFVVEYRILRQHDRFYEVSQNVSVISQDNYQGPWQALDFFLLGVDFTENGHKYHYHKEFEPCCGNWMQIRITSRTLHKNEYIFIDDFELKGRPFGSNKAMEE